MRLYIAGPMRGLHLYGLHRFAAAAWHLRLRGHVVFNPMERDLALDEPLEPHQDLENQSFDLKEAMTADIRYIASLDCDGIALLPGWKASRGAVGEVEVANICGKAIFELEKDFSLSEISVVTRLSVDNVATL
jgi:hypothetical protein